MSTVNVMGMRRWQVVLISPKEGGNVGAAARVLKNFGAGGLRVVEPRCEVNGDEARRFSSGAAELLRGAAVYTSLQDAVADAQITIGLTGVSGKMHRLDCTTLVPGHLLEGRENCEHGALVFGREERGMTGEEMECCDFLWSLPSNPAFPSLNLAQAIAVSLAGLAEAERIVASASADRGLAPTEKALSPLAGNTEPDDQPATNAELERVSEHMREFMLRLGWPAGAQIQGSASKLRNLFARGHITCRETSILHALFRKSLRQLKDDPKE